MTFKELIEKYKAVPHGMVVEKGEDRYLELQIPHSAESEFDKFETRLLMSAYYSLQNNNVSKQDRDNIAEVLAKYDCDIPFDVKLTTADYDSVKAIRVKL